MFVEHEGLKYVSFLQAFASYLTYKRDNNELLLFILRQLASDQLTFNRNRYRGGEVELVEIPEEEFMEKVKSGVGCWKEFFLCVFCLVGFVRE